MFIKMEAVISEVISQAPTPIKFTPPAGWSVRLGVVFLLLEQFGLRGKSVWLCLNVSLIKRVSFPINPSQTGFYFALIGKS